jgi:geranylgeranyl reductase family protein
LDQYDLLTDIAIIGAGPAGCSASIFLSKHSIKHIVFEKAAFPRDKICGDGLSGKVMDTLNKMELNIVDAFTAMPNQFLPSYGVRFAAPNGKAVNIPFSQNLDLLEKPPGFVAKRMDFDAFLFSKLENGDAEVHQKAKVVDIIRLNDGLQIIYEEAGKKKKCFAQLLISAEGERSITAKKFAGYKMQPKHYSAGIRAYYKNVTHMQKGNFIELHFIKEALPGYFWIFPLPNNEANVGLGMLSDDLREQNVNLKHIMLSAIQKNKTLRRRFKNAEMVSKIEAWGLPLGSTKPNISGERFILTGDAASLIDPFTGEGIGNALLSGKIAAEIARLALSENNFSANFLKQYDTIVYDKTWDETNLSYKLQRMVRFPFLFNFVINRLNKNTLLRETFTAMFSDLDIRSKLRSPLFYLKLLLGRK